MTTLPPLAVVLDHDADRAGSWGRAAVACGFVVDTATDGPAALALLYRIPPARPMLLLVASDLPGMGAIACARAARTLPGRARIPVVWGGAAPDSQTMPLSVGLPGPDAAALATVWERLAPLALPDPLRLLVACPAPADRQRLTAVLTAAGCLVQAAATTAEAAHRIHAFRPDAVLLHGDLAVAGLATTRRGWHLATVGGAATTLPAGSAALIPLDEPGPTLLALVARWLGDPGPLPEAPLLDRTTVSEVLDYGPDAAGVLLETFRSDRLQRLMALDQALAQGDAGAAIEALHALKGGAGGLGLARLRRHAAALEHAARSHDLARVAAGRAHLDELARAAEAAFATAVAGSHA